MGNFINKLQCKFSTIPNALTNDKRLSMQARFVYVFMASKPSGWNFLIEVMSTEIGCNKKTLEKYVKELIKYGWLVKGKQKNDCGKFGAVEYTLMDDPTVTQNTADQKTADQKTADQDLGHGNNTDITNTDITNNYINNIPPLSPKGETTQKSKFDLEKIFEGYGAEWIELFKQWLDYKREKKNTYKGEKSMRTMAKKLFEMAGGDIVTARAIVEQSMANNWQGLFELKTDGGAGGKTGRYKGDSTIGTNFIYRP